LRKGELWLPFFLLLKFSKLVTAEKLQRHQTIASSVLIK
jgi:hypothetical protein